MMMYINRDPTQQSLSKYGHKASVILIYRIINTDDTKALSGIIPLDQSPYRYEVSIGQYASNTVKLRYFCLTGHN